MSSTFDLAKSIACNIVHFSELPFNQVDPSLELAARFCLTMYPTESTDSSNAHIRAFAAIRHQVHMQASRTRWNGIPLTRVQGMLTGPITPAVVFDNPVATVIVNNAASVHVSTNPYSEESDDEDMPGLESCSDSEGEDYDSDNYKV
ncbi:hypothetical protein C8J56DRAFT_1040037 [Mycena floridula]|nr:hypothetical protein C8J56DRAFT_1040037 [Mycena floridula]